MGLKLAGRIRESLASAVSSGRMDSGRERSVPELPEALQGNSAGLALTCVTVPFFGKGLWTLLVEEDETSGESSGTQQAD